VLVLCKILPECLESREYFKKQQNTTQNIADHSYDRAEGQTLAKESTINIFDSAKCG